MDKNRVDFLESPVVGWLQTVTFNEHAILVRALLGVFEVPDDRVVDTDDNCVSAMSTLLWSDACMDSSVPCGPFPSAQYKPLIPVGS